MHTSEVSTFPPCVSSDIYYAGKLNPDRPNVRLSRNLTHALHEFFNKAGDASSIKITRGWSVEFMVENKAVSLTGRHLPSLICEAAIVLQENNPQIESKSHVDCV